MDRRIDKAGCRVACTRLKTAYQLFEKSLGWDWSLGSGLEKKEEEKISHMCESVGHWHLWAAAQKGGQRKIMI